jgi:hypothetical protein
MQLTTEHVTLNLARNHCARLLRARNTHVQVAAGVAWLTIDGQLRDIVLGRGETFVVDSNEEVVLFALEGPTAVELRGQGIVA